MSVSNPALAAVCACASLLLLWLSLHLRHRHRLIADLPTSKVQGVFIGLIELKGTRRLLFGQALEELRLPLPPAELHKS